MSNPKISLQHVEGADEFVANAVILGTFEGECADANFTNLNGLDITRPVWEHVFESEEYERGIKYGWFIGFLGHPNDTGCQDFEHACIIMREGHIDDNGKVYGKFDLIDTSVGRIVKIFQDAGVQFGISVRGAGDIVNNSVEPETFVFRGFDLVAFPAFPNSIPKFTAIAASTDMDQQAQYKKICAAVEVNIDSLNTVEAVDIVAAQFAEQSDMRKKLEARKAEILSKPGDEVEEADPELHAQVLSQKLEGMTQLYVSAAEQNTILSNQIADLQKQLNNSQRKLRSIERITAAQQADLLSGLDTVTASYETSKRANVRLKKENSDVLAQNLKYKQNIDASSKVITEKESVISKLQSELAETVNASSELKSRSSNLDASNKKLNQKLTAATKLIQEYQDAYASLYANAIGVELTNVKVTASTSVSELQQSIRSNVSTPSSYVSASTYVDTVPDIDVIDTDTDDLVTL